MLTIFEFIFATIGLTIIVTLSKLLEPLRNISSSINGKLGYLMRCPMCFGFWAGIMVYLIRLYNLDIINYGFIGSFFSYISYLLLRPLMDKYD